MSSNVRLAVEIVQIGKNELVFLDQMIKQRGRQFFIIVVH